VTPPSPVHLTFSPDLTPARFMERPNRFLVRARLPDQEVVEAHLPDPGRLRELLRPEAPLWLEPVQPGKSSNRRTRWTLRLCRSPDGDGVVSLDSTLPNRLIALALREEAMEEFRGWQLSRSEVTVGGSRFDFLLERSEGPQRTRRLLLEVKSVTLVENGVGLFPDAVTARGARHVRELTRLEAENWDTAVLFVLQRNDATEIRAAADIDPHFAATLDEAEAAGVRVLGRRCRVDLKGISLGPPIPAAAG